jgi:hypothetical protein
VIKVTEARKTILKEGKEGGKNDYINIENVGNTSLHVVVSNDKGHKTGKTIFAVFFTVFSFPFNCNIPFGFFCV